MKVVYVILHFQAYDITVECVESVLCANQNIDYHIVIVDNGSNNDSGDRLKNKYLAYENVTVLLNDKNVGFAQGNNVGYSYALQKLKADIIVAMNNDIIIEQKDFGKCIIETINSNPEVAVLAPDIITKTGEHQNPLGYNSIKTKKILFVLSYSIFMQITMRIPFINKFVLYLLKRKHMKVKNNRKEVKKIKRIYNIVPHGAMVIYTKKYTSNEQMAFCPDTFLYGEEDLLFDYLMRHNYSTLYVDKLKINHLEDVSTDICTVNTINKKLFMSKHKIHSCIVLLKHRLKYH